MRILHLRLCVLVIQSVHSIIPLSFCENKKKGGVEKRFGYIILYRERERMDPDMTPIKIFL